MRAEHYPAHLPYIASWSSKPAPRSKVSKERGMARAVSRKRMRIDSVTWDISDADAPAFNHWYDVDLLEGQCKFAIVLPGAGGWIARIARFVPGTVSFDLIEGNGFICNAQLFVTAPARD